MASYSSNPHWSIRPLKVYGIPEHKDLLEGTGPVAEGFTAVVYLAGSGTLILRDDFDGTCLNARLVELVRYTFGAVTYRSTVSC